MKSSEIRPEKLSIASFNHREFTNSRRSARAERRGKFILRPERRTKVRIGPSSSPCNWKPWRTSSHVSTAGRITGRFLPAYRIITGISRLILPRNGTPFHWKRTLKERPPLKEAWWWRKRVERRVEVVTKSQVGSTRGVAHS